MSGANLSGKVYRNRLDREHTREINQTANITDNLFQTRTKRYLNTNQHQQEQTYREKHENVLAEHHNLDQRLNHKVVKVVRHHPTHLHHQ